MTRKFLENKKKSALLFALASALSLLFWKIEVNWCPNQHSWHSNLYAKEWVLVWKLQKNLETC